MLKNEENMVKSRVTLPLRQMTTYEQCMKFGAMLNPLALNRWPQDAQGMQGCGGKDCTTNIGEVFNGLASNAERGPIDQEMMRGLVEVN